MVKPFTKYTEIGDTRIASYSQVEQYMRTVHGEMLIRRKVGNNTYLQRGPDGIELWLHQTPIVTWTRSNTVRLRTDGWYSMITKSRMNQWLPGTYDSKLGLYVASLRDGSSSHWWVGTAYSDLRRWPRTKEQREGWVPFYENIEFDLVTCTLFTPDSDVSADIEWNNEIDRKINRWLKQVDADTDRGSGWQLPPSIDTEFNDLVAFWNQCFEKVMFPSGLFYDIACERGFSNPSYMAQIWQDDLKTGPSSTKTWARRVVRQYLRKRLYRGAVAVKSGSGGHHWGYR